MGYESTLAAFEASMQKLQLEYLDLYLIHWPGKDKSKYKATWRAFEKLYRDGRIRAIGVSNFHIPHLEELMADATIRPMVNQIEFHPHLTQKPLRQYCERFGIQYQAWSPLKQGQLLDEPTLIEIGNKYNKSAAQVILRWDLQHKVVTIPKSTNLKRIEENADIFDFRLTEQEMEAIDQLDRGERISINPDDTL